jgi:hypothetical protein
VTVTTIFASTNDGEVLSSNVFYGSARDGSSLVADSTAIIERVGQLIFSGSYLVFQSFIDFDTSAITDTDRIDDIQLQMFLETDFTTTNFECRVADFNWGPSVLTSDFRSGAQLDALDPGSVVATRTMYTGASDVYVTFSSQAAFKTVTNIKTGTVKLILYSFEQVGLGSAPAGNEFSEWSSADVAGTTEDPKLVITHSIPSTFHTEVPLGGVVIGGEVSASMVDNAGGQVDADVSVLWDFDNDDNFDEEAEDITSFVIAAEAQSGRDFPSQLSGKAGPGRLRLALDNRDDRFNYFNPNSPLVTGANSLRVGRKIRLQTASTAVTGDPHLIVRDRFNRTNGPIGTAETGHVWETFTDDTTTPVFKVADKKLTANIEDNNIVQAQAWVESGLTSYYVQATIEQLAQYSNNLAGLIAERLDSDDYITFTYNPTSHIWELYRVDGGSATDYDSYVQQGWPGITIGMEVTDLGGNDFDCVGYIDGVPVTTISTSITGSGRVGVTYDYDGISQAIVELPILDNFHVWDTRAVDIEGVLWTGDVTEIRPSVAPGGVKIAEVSAEGRLARLALPDITSSRAPTGAPTGILVGDALQKAGLLHPPGTIAQGTVTTGPVTLDDGGALDTAREFEETELGFLYEAPEGSIGFKGRNARALESTAAAFSDSPDGQFSYEALTPLDQRRDIVNRVTAGVAPVMPTIESLTFDFANTGAGVANNVAVGMPAAVDAGDLLVVFIASTVGSASVSWLNPIWWHNWRDELRGGDLRTRVYSHPCNGTEGGTTVTFYIDSGASGGAWNAHIFRIKNWYQADTGSAISDFVDGANPPAFDHGFGRTPTLFIAVNAALTSVSGGSLLGAASREFPDGYVPNSAGFLNGSVNGFDLGLVTAHKFAVAESDDPTTFNVYSGFAINESFVFAVRGFNGPHVITPIIKKKKLTGVDVKESRGLFVTVDDVASQDELRVIRSHQLPSNLFAEETDAENYAELILETFKDDRPVFSITFTATTSAAYRRQAYSRRVGDKIRLIAENDTGMGVNAEFIIESVSHQITDGATLWKVTWELSPA